MNKSKVRNDLFLKSDLWNDLSKSDKDDSSSDKKSVFGSSQKRIIFVLLCLFTIMFESKQEFIVLFDFNFDLPMLILTSIQMHLNLWSFMGFYSSVFCPQVLQEFCWLTNQTFILEGGKYTIVRQKGHSIHTSTVLYFMVKS